MVASTTPFILPSDDATEPTVTPTAVTIAPQILPLDDVADTKGESHSCTQDYTYKHITNTCPTY